MKVLLNRHSLSLILLSFSIVSLTLGPASAQSKVDYKAVPILQAMKEVAPTPDINLATPDGKKLSLKDFRGEVVLLNFCATWCVPCREEMPAMEKLYQNLRTKTLSSSRLPSKTANKTPSTSLKN